jgi:hypothetical protein
MKKIIIVVMAAMYAAYLTFGAVSAASVGSDAMSEHNHQLEAAISAASN